MDKYKVVILAEEGLSSIGKSLSEPFDVELVTSVEACLASVDSRAPKVIVVDQLQHEHVDFGFASALCVSDSVDGHSLLPPLVLLSPSTVLADKVGAFELGCDDYLAGDISKDEVWARIHKAIFNCIANEQLKGRLDAATTAAYAAMTSNSDLGHNVQLLLEMNSCQNLDELGLVFFRGLEHYGLSGSLQMRSQFGVKNMEANGMAKDLESQLLWQLRDVDRYVDFGRRTVMNFAQASLLIRNMPVDDPVRYGTVKDNTFVLLQGLDARIRALDDQQRLLDEKVALKKLSADVYSVMTKLETDYTNVMLNIVSAVEKTAEMINDKVPVFALTEEHELFLEQTLEDCVARANQIFGEGLKVDELFGRLSGALEKALDKIKQEDEVLHLAKAQRAVDNVERSAEDGVDLF